MKLNILTPYEVISSQLIVPQLSAVIEIFDEAHQADSSVIVTVFGVVEPLATPVPHDGRLSIVGGVRSGASSIINCTLTALLGPSLSEAVIEIL